MSTKGLTKLAGTYREHIEGWTCNYARAVSGQGFLFGVGTKFTLASGYTRTLTAARAAARAVVMAHEARGLDADYDAGLLRLTGADGTFYQHARHWTWESLSGSRWNTAPTLREARKAAREAAE